MMLAACLAQGSAQAAPVEISTRNSALLLEATEGKPLAFLHYGSPLSAADVKSLTDGARSATDSYPAYGNYPENEPAMSVVMPDGNMTLDLVVAGPAARSAESDGSTIYRIPMKDRVYPYSVTACYRVYPDDDLIESWVEAVNNGKGNVKIMRYDSAYLPITGRDVWMTSLYGGWANEAREATEQLLPGVKEITNTDGTRNGHYSRGEVMLSLDGRPQERSGEVIGVAVEYPGNYKLRVVTDAGRRNRLYAGVNERNSWKTLAKGEKFTTPPVAFVYSDKGMGEVSRRFHKWGRERRMAHGTTPNPVLLNSWEGVYFDINEPGMAQMMKDIASMGGELFVMDDGWFGGKYQRNTDNAALGDWTVDTRKLPHGINGLLDEADRQGVKFGIWIEPEMTNSASELFEKHPDWTVQAVRRDTVKGRGGTQLVLDMGNPKVQDFVFNMVDTLLTRYPRIAYIKWDANAPIMQHGSQYLPADRQSELYLSYHEGLLKTLKRIRAKYPDVMIQNCASGGGRVNWGLMPYFDEFWTSDNTDALQRIAMQYGTSYFFPAMAMGSHISAVPNHTTYRSVPLKFRVDVAMSGRLGMEIQPKDMSEADKEFCRKAIASYKEIRDVVQLGDLYRLQSPFDGKGAASIMYVAPAKDKAVYYWWRTDNNYGTVPQRPALDGLDPDATYRVTELNAIDNQPIPLEGKSFSGKYLMSNGLEFPVSHSLDWGKRVDYASRVFLLEKQ